MMNADMTMYSKGAEVIVFAGTRGEGKGKSPSVACLQDDRKGGVEGKGCGDIGRRKHRNAIAQGGKIHFKFPKRGRKSITEAGV